mgnify:CR=1 FL=1
MNYQHLLYFRTVAVLGSVTAAAQRLRLTPPTLSAQIRTLEDSLGVSLFDRSARGMLLTDAGQLALRYADRIFSLGAELEQALRGSRDRVVRVGVETSMVAASVRPLLARLAGTTGGSRVVCTFGAHDELIASLRALGLDLVLTRAPPADDAPGLESRLVMETEVAFFGNATAATALRASFPGSLAGASWVAPPKTPLRESIERWLARVGVTLAANIELADASLAAALAADGVGIVTAPLSAQTELAKRYDLEVIGIAGDVRARIHAVGAREALDGLLPDMVPEKDVRTDAPASPSSRHGPSRSHEPPAAEGLT